MRQLIPFAFLAALGVAVSGCDHRPLYGNYGNSASVVQQLADVSIEEQRTRAGQLVRNELMSSFGQASGSRYLLKMTVTERAESQSSMPGTSVDRYRYRLNVTYRLMDSTNGTEVAAGKTFSFSSYDTVQEPVADLQAAENARERAAREVGQDVRLRLSTFFATRES